MPDLTATIIIEARNFANQALRDVQSEVDGLQSALGNVGSGIALGAGIAAFEGLSNAIEGTITSAVKWQTTLTELQNNTTFTTAETVAAGEAAIAMSNKYGVASDNIVQGYRHVQDIVQNAAAAQEILNTAVEGSSAAGADASKVANILAGVMHEYGTDVQRAADGTVDLAATHAAAAHALGIMTAAAQDSNTTLDTWVGSLSTAIGIAAAGNQPIEQIGATFASLTLHGFPDAAKAGVGVKDIDRKSVV